MFKIEFDFKIRYMVLNRGLRSREMSHPDTAGAMCVTYRYIGDEGRFISSRSRSKQKCTGRITLKSQKANATSCLARFLVFPQADKPTKTKRTLGVHNTLHLVLCLQRLHEKYCLFYSSSSSSSSSLISSTIRFPLLPIRAPILPPSSTPYTTLGSVWTILNPNSCLYP